MTKKPEVEKITLDDIQEAIGEQVEGAKPFQGNPSTLQKMFNKCTCPPNNMIHEIKCIFSGPRDVLYTPPKINESALFFDYQFRKAETAATLIARTRVPFRPMYLWIETYQSIIIENLIIENTNVFIQENNGIDAWAFRSKYRLDMPTLRPNMDCVLKIRRTSTMEMKFHAELSGGYIAP